MNSNDKKDQVDFDDLIGKKEDIYGGLEDAFSEPFDFDEDAKEWMNYWKGMPEYKNDDNPPYKLLNVRFRTKEDYQDFANLIGQKLTDKTKSIWIPELDKKENSLLRWIVEDEEDDTEE